MRIVRGRRVVGVVELDNNNSTSLASSWRIELSGGNRIIASVLILAGSPRDAYVYNTCNRILRIIFFMFMLGLKKVELLNAFVV